MHWSYISFALNYQYRFSFYADHFGYIHWPIKLPPSSELHQCFITWCIFGYILRDLFEQLFPTNCAGVILGMGSAKERRRYYVMLSLIVWAHAHNDPCCAVQIWSIQPGGFPSVNSSESCGNGINLDHWGCCKRGSYAPWMLMQQKEYSLTYFQTMQYTPVRGADSI